MGVRSMEPLPEGASSDEIGIGIEAGTREGIPQELFTPLARVVKAAEKRGWPPTPLAYRKGSVCRGLGLFKLRC